MSLLFFYNDCKESFDILKKALITAPIVQSPHWNLCFEIMCDASDYGVGVVLGQRIDNELNVIVYGSKTLDNSQRNYATTENKIPNCCFACDKFTPYFITYKVTSHTGHAAIKYFMD